MLVNRFWNGRNSPYPLKVCIARHREAFNELFRASYQINYVPPNEIYLFRYLLTSVQTNDPTIFSAKINIQAYAAKKNDFESVADFLLITAPSQKHPIPSNHRISSFSSKRGKVNIGPNTGV